MGSEMCIRDRLGVFGAGQFTVAAPGVAVGVGQVSVIAVPVTDTPDPEG